MNRYKLEVRCINDNHCISFSLFDTFEQLKERFEKTFLEYKRKSSFSIDVTIYLSKLDIYTFCYRYGVCSFQHFPSIDPCIAFDNRKAVVSVPKVRYEQLSLFDLGGN